MKKRLIGTITNGDIRRNLIKGYTKNDDLIYIINKKPIYVKEIFQKIRLQIFLLKTK